MIRAPVTLQAMSSHLPANPFQSLIMIDRPTGPDANIANVVPHNVLLLEASCLEFGINAGGIEP